MYLGAIYITLTENINYIVSINVKLRLSRYQKSISLSIAQYTMMLDSNEPTHPPPPHPL